MTKDEIIEMARQAGFLDADDKGVWITDGYWTKELEAFAKLVAEKERESCAKVADGWPDYDVQGLATAIRARSNP
jgi:hypothetical protein